MEKAIKAIIKLLLAASVIAVSVMLTDFITEIICYRVPEYAVVSEKQVASANSMAKSTATELAQDKKSLSEANMQNDDLKDKIVVFEEADSMRNEDASEVINNIVLQRSVENSKILLAAKGVILGSFGYTVPEDIYSDNSAEEFENEMKDKLLDSVIGEYAEGELADVIKNGVKGAADASDGTAGSILSGAANGVISGAISDAPKKFLGDEINGIFDKIGFVSDVYEGATEDNSASDVTYLKQKLANSMGSELTQIEQYVDADQMSSDDFASLIYLYHQYGSDVDSYNEADADNMLDFEWQSDYEELKQLYEAFEANQAMIEALREEQQ